MTKKKEEKMPVKPPETESTPIKFWKQDGDEKMNVSLAHNAEEFVETLKSVIGVKDSELAWQILNSGVAALKPMCGEKDSFNVILQSMHDIQPKDVIEARLAVQASALFSHGMSNLRRAESADMMCHADHYGNKAIKLLRLHNETIETLNRYRRGGEQKVTVTHAVITEKAIVNNFNGMGGVSPKNEGESPCSQRDAEQKPELTNINHAANQPWQTEDVGSMEAKASVPKQK